MVDSEKALIALQESMVCLVKTSDDELYRASYDGLKVSCKPQALIKVQNEREVGEVLRLANEFSIPVTSRGTGSSLTGGATPVHGG